MEEAGSESMRRLSLNPDPPRALPSLGLYSAGSRVPGSTDVVAGLVDVLPSG